MIKIKVFRFVLHNAIGRNRLKYTSIVKIHKIIHGDKITL